jgi:hypothetical protein
MSVVVPLWSDNRLEEALNILWIASIASLLNKGGKTCTQLLKPAESS